MRNHHYVHVTNDTMILLRGIFSIFSVWHRLTTLFDAEDDPRVPAFQVIVLTIILIAIIDIRMAAYILTILIFKFPQTYIHMAAYIFTILWGIIRPSVCFKYCPKIRRALGP